jgi:F0F1-type ATP synthase assembly protein I
MNIIQFASIILGIVASAVPNLLFRRVFFRHTVQTPQQIVRLFYWGAVFKFVGFVLLFCLILQWPSLQTKMFFVSFVATQIGLWLINWFGLRRIITL